MLTQVEVHTEVVGPDVVTPGSSHLAPVFFGFVTMAFLTVAVVAFVLRRRRPAEIRRRPIVLGGATAGVVVFAIVTGIALPPAFFTPEFPPLGRLFPDEAFLYRTTEDLPVAEQSDRWIETLPDLPVMAGFGGPASGGVVFGIPFNLVDDDTPRKPVDIKLATDRSFPGPYPITDPAYIESMPTYGFDNHYIAVDRKGRTMWELLSARAWFGRWQADAGARWDLDDLTYPSGSTIAAGLPLLAGTLTYDEVAAGEVDHVVYAGVPVTRRNESVWPARKSDGRSDDPDAPPMGAWLRLRDDADLSELGPQARVIAEGLRRYGLILSDTGPGFALRGTPDGRWDRADLRTLRSLTTSDFEAVDASGVMVSPDSMAARPPAG